MFCSTWPDVVDLPRPVLGLRYGTAELDLLVLHNLGPTPFAVPLPALDGHDWTEVLGSARPERDGVVLRAYGSVWLQDR